MPFETRIRHIKLIGNGSDLADGHLCEKFFKYRVETTRIKYIPEIDKRFETPDPYV